MGQKRAGFSPDVLRQPETENTRALKETVEKIVAILKSRKPGEAGEEFDARYDEAREDCLQKYPNRRQEIELLFDFAPFLQRAHERALHKARTEKSPPKMSYEESWKEVIGLTEFQCRATNYITENAGEREHLERFWEGLERIAKAANIPGSPDDNIPDGRGLFVRYRSGILGQAAAYHILERLGQKPSIATPEEDATGTDVRAQIDSPLLRTRVPVPLAFQVKTNSDFTNVEIIAPHLTGDYPTTEISVNGKLQTFRVLPPGKPLPLKPAIIQLPYFAFDRVTGEPTEKTVSEFKEKLTQVVRLAQRGSSNPDEGGTEK